MSNVTLQISDEELAEVAHAFGVIQRFLDKVVSPNDLYRTDFLMGLDEARSEVLSGDYSEVKSFDDFID